MIRVLLADDHDLVREGIARLLRREEDIRVVAQAEDGDAALRIVSHREVDVAILDVSMPGPGIFELLRRIHEENRDCRCLVLSVYPEERWGVRIIRAGAAGYLAKERSPAELVEAIRRIAREGRYITERLADCLAMELQAPGDRPAHETLSDREFQVLRLTAEGLSGLEIGEKLDVTPQTVSTYRARIREKLGLETVADMVRYALDHGIAD